MTAILKDSTILGLAGIVSLTIIELACLLKGIDHFVLAGVVTVIGVLAGYEIRVWRERT